MCAQFISKHAQCVVLAETFESLLSWLPSERPGIFVIDGMFEILLGTLDRTKRFQAVIRSAFIFCLFHRLNNDL